MMPSRMRVVSNALGLAGALAGGVFGYVVFVWIVPHGYKAPILPGAMLGLGCSLLARHPSTPRGVACALGALALGIYTEWANWPFVADGSLGYFLTHVFDLNMVTLVMIGLGGVLAFWLGKDSNFGRPEGPGKGAVRDAG